MMAEKARLFKDYDAEDEIMEATHPAEQKKIGRRVQNFNGDVWDEVARDIVYKGNYAKFTQNPGMQEVLVETVGTTLVEASPYDRIWGIGLDQDDPDCHDRDRWQGLNWLGEVLTQVREDIMMGIERKTPEDFAWTLAEF